MTKHAILQGRGAHAIRTRIMMFREVLTFLITVSSGSAWGTWLTPLWSHIGDDFGSLVDLLGSRGLSWASLGPPAGSLGTLLELSWGALASSWRSLGPPSASLGRLLALKGGSGGLRASFFVDLGVDV